MPGKIICHRCAGLIDSKDDLVVVSRLGLEAYHNHCYAEEMKTFSGLFLSRFPINSPVSNVMTIFFALILTLLLCIHFSFWLLLLGLLVVGIRGVSWYFYERLLK